MNRLARRMARAIEMDGPLSIAAFATMALHDREDGFYASRESIGARGAFITAPEISQIFGELLGLWCVQAWRDQGSPTPARLVELGPGRGTLVKDALRAAHIAPDFLARLEVVLVETSPALEAAQREQLRDAPAATRWVSQWDAIACDRPLFLLANEFFDALPIRQFVMTQKGWCERMVIVNAAGDLAFALAPISTPLDIPVERGAAEPGAVYETSPAAQGLVEEASRAIAACGGGALFIDYGHEGCGFGDTLQAVSRHRQAGILDAPGESDLSAHVDFAALARIASKAGAHAYGPIGQGEFLRTLGIGVRGARLAERNPACAEDIAMAIDRLTSKQEMGALFKAFAISPGSAPPPPGF
ncbi:MAG TPA: SAM-dependent methyltransferase [Rhizomicrobium sp.]|jgi:NADH dehydrogenase [ubiquinone] 1 alpha subcomplex assembly factor 7|nr:SAM-dependent methyltransferase [Rhizomicrobium sp.]